jgi:hypothetical protein
MSGPKLRGALVVAVLGAALGIPSAASAQDAGTSTPFFNCRASAVFASVAGFDRVEPLVANGNPNTGAGKSPDFALCADADSGVGSLATQLGIGPELLSAPTASARTSIVPPTAQPADQTATADARVEDLKLPLTTGGVVLGVGAATSSAQASCTNGQPALTGTSQVTNITLAGTPITLDDLLSALTTALAPLGPLVEVQVNEQVRDGQSLTVRALHVKVLRDAGSAPLLDVVVAESKVTAPQGVCLRRSTDGPNGGRPCPDGATLDGASGKCVIVVPGTGTNGEGGKTIVIGFPFQGPSGGRVVALSQARQDARYRTSPCVRQPGAPEYVIVGTNGNDRITGTNGPDRILGLGGNDSLAGGRGDDCLDGGAGRDVLSGSIGNDRIYGMAGNDALNGGGGTDRLSGGTGNDTINAGFGADRVFGGPGRDAINVATAGKRARVSCGSGLDTVRFNVAERRTIGRDCERRFMTRRIRKG